MKESTKRTVTYFTIAASLAPSLLFMRFPATPTIASVTLWASAVAGYMGIVLLLWMYILGTKSVMSLVYRDLAPVLSIHKWLGKYGTLAILLHPLLITISYAQGWFYALLPRTATVADRHMLLGQIALGLLVLVAAISVFLRKKLSFRAWKYTHYLAYICIPFALLHVPDLGTQEQGSLFVKGYLFLLGLTYLAFLIVRVRGLLNLDKTPYTVAEHVQLTDLDYMVRLTPVGASHIRPRRGQYVYIKLGLLSEDHPFTVTQFSKTTGEITLAYRLAGMYTQELTRLAEGQRVFLNGPYGQFMMELPDHPSTPVIYIAGGIGITPFVDHILNESDTREQWLFAGNRTHELAVLYEPLKRRLGDHAVAVYSREQFEGKPNEEPGYINYDLISKYVGDVAGYQFYLCGPEAMVTSITNNLRANGIADDAIHSEAFGW